MPLPRFCDIDPRCINACVPKQVSKTGDVLIDRIKQPGKQVAQVVRKHLLLGYLGLLAERFHVPPDIAAVDRLSAFGYEHSAVFDSRLFCIFPQKFLHRDRYEDHARFVFAADRCLSGAHSLCRNVLQLADTDPCAANRAENIR